MVLLNGGTNLLWSPGCVCLNPLLSVCAEKKNPPPPPPPQFFEMSGANSSQRRGCLVCHFFFLGSGGERKTDIGHRKIRTPNQPVDSLN